MTIRDRLRYCNVLLDDNQRKRICKFWFNSTPKHIGLFDTGKEERVRIEELEDIFDYADRIIGAIRRIDGTGEA